MSIINDAIKKARKEFELKKKPMFEADYANPLKQREYGRWVTIMLGSLIIIVSLFGSIFIFHKAARLGPVVDSDKITGAFVERRDPVKTTNAKALELNGIVYGPEDKWAIINNKIFREGDEVFGGRLVSIQKGFVLIEKKGGGKLRLESPL